MEKVGVNTKLPFSKKLAMPVDRFRSVFRFLEKATLVAGTAGLFIVSALFLESWLLSKHSLHAFESTHAQLQSSVTGSETDSALNSPQAPLVADKLPLAVLEVSTLDLRVPVFAGTDRRTLSIGAGVVDGTAHPGESGNIVISAHRDSFFRPLEHISSDDIIELRTPDGVHRYRVREIFITDPLNISVLTATDENILTLITCYPFTYIGFALERFIIRSERINADSPL